jgi:hypothetical protein
MWNGNPSLKSLEVDGAPGNKVSQASEPLNVGISPAYLMTIQIG